MTYFENKSSIIINLFAAHGNDCSVIVEYNDACYIANVVDKDGNAVRGYLYDLSLKKIQTPLLEQIEKTDFGLYGKVGNKKCLLLRTKKDDEITFDFKE